MGKQAAQTVFGVAAVLFLLAPIVAIVPLAFTSSTFLNYPIDSYSLRWFDQLATDATWRRSIGNSLIIGGSATALSLALGILAALGLRGSAR